MEEENITTMEDKSQDGVELTPPMPEPPTRCGYLTARCNCGNKTKMSDEIIKDGISWTMIVGNEHYITLNCSECGAGLTMFIEEIIDENELPEESNKE